MEFKQRTTDFLSTRIADLGWNSFFESYFAEFKQFGLLPARVVEEFKGFYRVRSAQAEYLAESAGKLQHQAVSREDLPAVGDWVVVMARPEEGRARIEHILPRRTKLSRKVAGREMSEQIVATNLDTVFVVSALNLVSISLPGPYTFVWLMAFVLYLAELLLAISYDGEDTIGNVGYIALMYFTYCQLWIYIVLRVMYVKFIKREKNVWDKTVRFEVVKTPAE